MSVKFAALILFIRAFVQSDYAAQAVVVALSVRQTTFTFFEPSKLRIVCRSHKGSLRDNNDYSVMDNRQSSKLLALYKPEFQFC